MSDKLRGNGLMNDALGSAMRSGDHALGTIPALLKRVLADETWREFITKRGEHVEYERFAEFVVTVPLKGIGATVDLVRRVVADDPEALDLLDQALQNPHGGDRKSAEQIKISNIQLDRTPTGTTKARALRKLRTESERGNQQAAELHAEVLAGHISANAAMIRGGFRSKMISVPVGHPDRIAAYLRRYMTRAELAQLTQLLTKENPMPTWEYKIAIFDERSRTHPIKEDTALAEHGEDGWEAFAVDRHGLDFRVFFKRPRQASGTENTDPGTEDTSGT